METLLALLKCTDLKWYAIYKFTIDFDGKLPFARHEEVIGIKTLPDTPAGA